MATVEQYLNQSVIRGTLRPQDLLPAFLDVLADVAPDECVKLTIQPYGFVPAHAQDDENADWWQSEECWWCIGELTDALDACAPEGYYFGTLDGDGSDFGFWQIEE